MKKLFLVIVIFALSLINIKTNPASATVNDFYFDSARFDYYLEKTTSGSSVMRVQEALTAVFPSSDQNHGIIRCLPQTSFSKKAYLDESSFEVKVNNNDISYTAESSYPEVCFKIGDASEYVHGTTTYIIDYTYKDVIIDPIDSDNQELYWDANGTGWSQRFNSIVATVHLTPELAESIQDSQNSGLSCYVGEYGVTGPNAQRRCRISSTSSKQSIVFSSIAPDSDGFSGVNERETLTFDIAFKPDTFEIENSSESASSYVFSPTDTNDFYFSEGVFDYYLNKKEDGASTMQVIEKLTAQFPNFNRNHGITRCIPKKYNGTSIFANKTFRVLRNGKEESFSTYTEDGELCLRIGSADSYVQNEQVYEITYNLENVILQPKDSENQELYWDINGNGWYQQFNSIIARIHLPESLNSARISQLESDLSCYAGKYGISNQSNCIVTTESSDEKQYSTILQFATTNIKSQETLTINIPFKNGTFIVKGPDPNYLLYGIIAALGISTIVLIRALKKANDEVKDKKALAKSKIVPVQYIPPTGLTVAEAGEVWLKSPKSSQVATLMELAVTHKIELERGEKKILGGYKWKIHIKSIDGNTEHQNIVLKILNGGDQPNAGDVIEVKRRSSTSKLVSLGNQYPEKIENSLKNKLLFEQKKKSSTPAILIIVIILIMFFGMPAFTLIVEAIGNSGASTVAILAIIAYVVASFIIFPTAFSTISKYKERTMKGIETSKYLDGLKEYMELAEKDRIAFLQSVKGVDTSHNGIARLYERLLPYAVLFNIEESWFNELNKYYEMEDVTSADWVTGAAILSASDFHSFSSYTSSSISGSTASSDSGGSSGGGGGGFSGGGGGGGGGGGW